MKKSMSFLLALLLTASLILPAGAAFVDVGEGRWYSQSVDYVTSHGLFEGVGGGKFDPYGSMTRGMFVLVLSRVAGADVSATPSAGFADVRPDKYYAGAVNWASRNGYAPGMSSTAFEPERAITREEIAVIVYNYLSRTGTVLEPDPAAPAAFSDFSSVSAGARAAVEYVRWMGLMNGSGGKFDPAGTLKRSEAAEVFMRLSQRLEGAQASNWHVTAPVLVLETSTQDAASAYGDGKEWGQVRVTDPYNGIKDFPADPIGYGYKLEVSDESVIKVNSWAGLYSPRQLEPGADPVRAVVTITRPDGSQRQMLVLVTAKAAKEEDPEPSASPEPEVAAFTVTTPSFDLKTTIYRTPSAFTVVNGRQVYYQIRITDPSHSIVDRDLTEYLANLYGYTFESSDPTVVEVDAGGKLINPRQLAPGDAPVSATVTVTNANSGQSAEVTVTVSPDPKWYAADDDYLATCAAEILRLVNELRIEAGVPPVSYDPEYQELINTRTAHLEKFFSHGWIGTPKGFITGENIAKRGIASSPNGGIAMAPEAMAVYYMDGWTNSPGHYENMMEPYWDELTVGIYINGQSMTYGTQWFH